MATPPKKKTETNFLPPLLPKMKKTRLLSLVHAEALIDWMKFLFLKLGYNPLPDPDSLISCTYIGERRTTFAKAEGMRCYGEHVGAQIGNLL
jgi:hypothetical protein